MKSITIAGGVTRDATLRKTQGGDSVLGFSVGVDDRTSGERRSMYFDCSLWGKRAEALSQYLTKGTRVAVSGEMSTREHDGRTYLTVRANEVTLLGGGEQRQQRDDQPRNGAPAGGGRSDFDDIDLIPF